LAIQARSLRRAPALVGVGLNQRIAPEHPAQTAGAFAVYERRVDTDLDLESDIAVRLLLFRLAQVGGERAGADDAEHGHAASLLAAEQRVCRLVGGAADEIVQRDLDRGLCAVVAVHARIPG